MTTAWDKGRPVFLELPRDGYQNNKHIDALLQQPDEFYSSVKLRLETFWMLLDPAICPAEWLDWLGWVYGWSGAYWNALWPASVKRTLIANTQKIFSRLGQAQTISLVLGILGVEHSIWTEGVLVLGFPLPATFQTPRGQLFIRLPLKYIRQRAEWLDAYRVREGFVPCVIENQVVYEYFYLGYSQLGEPLFS